MEALAPGMIENFVRHLREAVGEVRFKTWLSGHTKFGVEGKDLLIGVPNRFYRDWLDTQYREYIESAIARSFGTNMTIRFRIDPELFRDHQRTLAEQRAVRVDAQSSERSAPTKAPPPVVLNRYSLSRFVVGPANRVAHAAVTTLVDDPRRAYSPLLLHGNHGLGKTHLLKGIEDECLRRHRHMRILAITGEEFTNSYLEALKTHRISAFRSRVRNVDLLLVDDVHFVAGKTRTQEEFLHTLNALENRNAKLVLACDCHPRKLERMPEELQGRLMSGMVAALEPMDFDMRRQVVVDKCVGRKVPIAPEIIDFLAENLRTSVSEIEGAINYLEHYAETLGRKLTLESVRQALAEILRHSIPMIRIEEVRERVCKLFRINPKAIAMRSRTRSVSHPRTLVLYLARKYTTATYSEIGREIAGLNHSSVIAAEHRIQEELHKDGEIVLGDRTWKVRDAIEAFEREIGPR